MATGDRALLSIDTKQAEWLRAKLASRARSIANKRSAMGQVVTAIDRWVQKNFQTEGRLAYPNQGWQKLSDSTIASRLRMKRTKTAIKKKGVQVATLPILQVNGWLRNRWRHYFDNNSAIIQSGVDYGIYHDSDKPRTKLPERKITPTEKQIMPELIKILGAHVRTSLRK